MSEETQKCAMHTVVDAVETVSRGIPVCQACKTQYDAEAPLPWVQQTFHRQLTYLAEAKRKEETSEQQS